MTITRFFEDYDDGTGKPAVVLIPGIGSGAANDRLGVLEMTRQFRVILINNPGLNGTRVPVHFSVARVVKRVRQVLEHLGIAKAHVVGHSMGGFTAQQFALECPERVLKLVLVSTSYGGPFSRSQAKASLARVQRCQQQLPLTERTGYSDGMLSLTVADHFMTRDPIRYRFMLNYLRDTLAPVPTLLRHLVGASLFDSYGHVHHVKRDTLVIHGTDDQIIPLEGGQLLAGQLPNARLLVYPNCGHMPMFERRDYYQDIIGFLQGEPVGEVAVQDNIGRPGPHVLELGLALIKR